MFRSIGMLVCLAAIAWGQTEVTTEFSCGAQLGVGLKSHRTFCDVVVSANPRDGITMRVPPHRGDATLMFDLHNRYTIPAPGASPAEMYAKHTAIVIVRDQSGAEISKAAVSRELRTGVDIFDRVAGGVGPDGAIAVAPGRAEAITMSLGESVTAIAIAGVSLEVMSMGERGTFTAPGRPVAIGSNFRIEYTPRHGS